MEELLWKIFHEIENEVVKNLLRATVPDDCQDLMIKWCDVMAAHNIGATEAVEIMKELSEALEKK